MKINRVMMRNMGGEELARFCRDSNNPLIQELAMRLLNTVAPVRKETAQTRAPRIGAG